MSTPAPSTDQRIAEALETLSAGMAAQAAAAAKMPPTFRLPAQLPVPEKTAEAEDTTGAGVPQAMIETALAEGRTPAPDQCWEITGLWIPVFAAITLTGVLGEAAHARITLRLLVESRPIYETETPELTLIGPLSEEPVGYGANTRIRESLTAPVYVPPEKVLTLQLLYTSDKDRAAGSKRLLGLSSQAGSVSTHHGGPLITPAPGLLTYRVLSLKEPG